MAWARVLPWRLRLAGVRSVPCRVWWLYGPPSVGKSATAWQLYAHLLDGLPRAYFDVDQVGMCYPEPPADPGRYALKARAAAALARRLAEAGASTVVVSGVLDPTSLNQFTQEVAGLPVTFCRLRANRDELTRRLTSRYGAEDAARAMGEAEAWDRAGGAHPVVFTDHGTPLEVARRVLEAVRGAAVENAPLASAPDPATAAAETVGTGRAVLICGPIGVGKSTVGFALFQHLLHRGRCSAYLDLAQLGFLADVPPAAEGGFSARAAAVADLWQHFRAVGAQDLVLSGSVDQLQEVASYRRALHGTPLLVARLRAGAEQLRERIADRVRGGGPALAGDALIGVSDEEAQSALDRALAQQAHLDETSVADVTVDTTDLDPAAAVHRLISSLQLENGDTTPDQ
jgi:adenylylsulfate kinase-like enzyme